MPIRFSLIIVTWVKFRLKSRANVSSTRYYRARKTVIEKSARNHQNCFRQYGVNLRQPPNHITVSTIFIE